MGEVGIVTKAVNGFFDVVDLEREQHRRCRARGVFRKKGITVLVGDRVRYDSIGLHEGVITEVEPRRTELRRPPVANVDQALLIFSLVTPDLAPQLLDKMIVNVQLAGLVPKIALSKCDLTTEAHVDEVARRYRCAGYRVLPVGDKGKTGLAAVQAELLGHITVFAGPSGAGKSTLANTLSPELGLKMGDLSEKLGRGKHTTRHVELFSLGVNTYIADAPGFSQVEVDAASSELRYQFPEFQERADRCAYRGCLHVDEAKCGVKAAVQAGGLSEERYTSYTEIFRELREREEYRY